ncbi:hypothetical protein M426DRAFT_268951 [Hypoxylon sp. CI-4A]|nr:hypothetical protein M426DRAFT_268951 [Hypoxylon sp. CI-4A]
MQHCQGKVIKDADFSRRFSETFQEDIVREITNRADGVFLWAFLVIRIILFEVKNHGTETDIKRKLHEIPDGIEKLYESLLGSLSPGDRRLANHILCIVLTNPFRDFTSVFCLKWLDDRRLFDRALLRNNNFTEVELEEQNKYVKSHLNRWTRGLLEEHVPMIPFTTPDCSLLATKVVFFHSTVREYFLQPERFNELIVDIDESNLPLLHTRLRLAELNSILQAYDVTSIHRRKLRTELYFYTGLGIIGNGRNSFKIPWQLIEQLFYTIPSSLECGSFGDCLERFPFYPLDVKPIHLQEDGYLPYFAASMGQINIYDLTETAKCSPNGSLDYKFRSRSILLSACLSGLLFDTFGMIEKAATENIVESLLRKGFSAHTKLEVYTSIHPKQYATVWIILISALSSIINIIEEEEEEEWNILSARAADLIKILGVLLHNEEQEEVLFLGYDIDVDRSYEYFITLEDIILLRNFDTKPQILEDLRDWPKYGTENQSDEMAPTWVWNWRGRSRFPVSSTLKKLNRSSKKVASVHFMAVVSRTVIFENSSGSSLPKFQVW